VRARAEFPCFGLHQMLPGDAVVVTQTKLSP
jgi:hypothetical protein